MMNRFDIDFYLIPKEEGGRKYGITVEYRAAIKLNGESTQNMFVFERLDAINGYDCRYSATIWFALLPKQIVVNSGQKFTMQEGSRIIGFGSFQ